MTKKRAFTLVELLVVIAIVAILAVAGVVGYTVFVDKAKISNAETEGNQAKSLLEAEDMLNNNFEITTDGIVFVGSYSFEDIFDDTDNEELKNLETKITYLAVDKNITIVSTSDPSFMAVWDLTNKTVKGQKV